jgi:hypothetical protein
MLQGKLFRKKNGKQTYNFKFPISVIKMYREVEVCKKLHAFLTSEVYEGVVILTFRLSYGQLSLDRRLGGLQSNLEAVKRKLSLLGIECRSPSP